MRQLLPLLAILWLLAGTAYAAQTLVTLPTTGTLSGLTTVQNINSNTSSLLTNSSGTSAPSYETAYQWWADTTNSVLYFFDGSTNQPVGQFSSSLWMPFSNGVPATIPASTGSSNAYVVTYSPAVTAYVAGQHYPFIANFSNTGSATENVNGLGAKTLKINVSSNLSSAAIANGQVIDTVYDGTNMQVLDLGGGGSGSGTVTSVAMTGDGTIFSSTVSGSPITTNGTLAPSLKTETANYFLAGPTTGSASAPTFRAIVAGDLPLATTGAVGGVEVGTNLAVSSGIVSVASSINSVNIGPSTPGTGSFTTLAASSTVSGTGFSSYLASPPAIGGTSAAAGTFTALTATGNTALDGTLTAASLSTSGTVAGSLCATSGGLILYESGGNCYSGGGSGTVTSIGTNNGLTGGTITTTGSIGLASVSNNTALCNNSGGSAVPTSANCAMTGAGNLVMATSPTLTTPSLGAATGSSLALTGAATVGGAVAIGTTSQTSGTALDLGSNTNSILMPIGTTGQRPGTGVNGMLRYNSTLSTVEAYANNAWTMLIGNYADLKEYGAKCDGSTDDTSSLVAASTANHVVYIDGSANGCVINSAVLGQTNVTLLGNFLGVLGYSAVPSGSSRLIAKSGATYILNLTSGISLSAYGIALDGNNVNVECISNSTNGGNIYDVRLQYDWIGNCANNGIGDTSYQVNLDVSHSQFYNNGANSDGDIVNPVDSHINNNDFASIQGDALYDPPGSNDNDFTNNKVEYSVSWGVYCYQATHNHYDNNIFDHNAYGAFAFQGCSNFSFNNNILRRNGAASTTYDQNADIYSVGGSSNYQIAGTVTNLDTTLNPQYFILNNGVDYNADMHDNDMTAITTSTPIYDNATQVNRTKHDNLGDSSPMLNGTIGITGGLTLSQISTPSAPAITTAGTSGAATWTYKIVGYTSSGSTTAASTGGSTTSGNATLTSGNYNIITFAPINGAQYYKVFRTAHGTSPTTLGVIGTVFPTSGSLVLNDTGQAGDATTAPTINNSGALNFSAGRSGTFVCTSGGSIVVSNTLWLSTSIVDISMNTPGGTVSWKPNIKTGSAGTSFTAICATSDTSTYNYTILN